MGTAPAGQSDNEPARSSGPDRPASPASPGDVYRGFVDALNRGDLTEAEHFVDVGRYRENCVGFTHGFVDWAEAQDSMKDVWKGLPDLRVELHDVLSDGDVALARATVRGSATGRLYGAPATKRAFEANFFDFVRVADGLIVERVQQTDVLGQMRQLYGKGLGLVGLGAMFWRL